MPAATAPPPGAELRVLVAQAADGDANAWRALCARLERVAWKTIRALGLRDADADDAFAATMFRLAENLPRIRDPERLPGWLATTARHEAFAIFRARRRTTPVADPTMLRPSETDLTGSPGDDLERDELQRAMREAFATLGPRCQQLLRLLSVDPPLSYDEIAATLGRPRGSIGPTRRRCLDELRGAPTLRTWTEQEER